MADRVYRGPLGPKIAAYVAERRAAGLKFVTAADQLALLDRLSLEVGWGSDALGRDLVEAFVAPRPGERPRGREIRATTVRCFGRHLAELGEDAYVLPTDRPARRRETVPRLLTEGEVARLLAAADSMAPRRRSPLRHLVVPMLLRVLYCCGLRISEAVGLTVGDVDLDGGVLLVRGAKFNRDRRVPMSSSLAERCREYSGTVHRHSPDARAYFPSPEGGGYARSTVGFLFRNLLASAGIAHYDDGPTLHSLRHSFAVHRLARWAAEGIDVNAMLPHLAAFMGHAGLTGTERYLRLTAEMLPDLRSLAERASADVVPGAV